MLYWADGLQTVHGELDEGTAHAHDINELLWVIGGGHWPEAATDAASHDDDLCVGVIAHCFEFLICCFYWDDILIIRSFEHEIRRRSTDRREVITRMTRIFFHADLTLSFYTHTDRTDLTDLVRGGALTAIGTRDYYEHE